MARALSTALLLFLPARALATESDLPRRVTLTLTACGASTERSAFSAALHSELGADGIEFADPADALLVVDGVCDGTFIAQIHLSSVATGRSTTQTLALQDARAEARPRALALSVSELVRSRWRELASTEAPSHSTYVLDAETAAPAASPAAPAPSEKAPGDARSPQQNRSPPTIATSDGAPRSTRSVHDDSPPFRVAAAGRGRWFVDQSSTLFGGELGMDRRALRLRAEALLGQGSDPFGTAHAGSVALAVSYRIAIARFDAFTVDAYPGASGGVTWLRGAAASPAIHVAPATGFYGDFRLGLEAALAGRFAPTLGLDIGRSTGFAARAGSRVLTATGGFFLGAGLGAKY